MSEGLEDITWQDLFKGEFWSSSIAQQIPYAATFLIPAGMVGKLASVGLKTVGFGTKGAKVLRKAQKSGLFGQMGKGVNISAKKGQKGSGLLGYLGRDLGKKGCCTNSNVKKCS